ncbi:ABC transporter permease subunit [uncultured Jannaschia sp.]|uniref:ABC transporter permease n=1 Tax=uncultured Jannaschia sp. TaxID=293347 RepID=UPI002623B61B|nr:ABC transporter permease subunit [uncultured Jannaschia sp.]
MAWQVLSVAGLLVAWEALARLNAGSYVLAGPVAVTRYGVEHAGLLAHAAGITLANAAWGFLWGNLAAVALAAAILLVPRLERCVVALSLVVFCLPLVATGPILRVALGPGNGPQIALAALAVHYTTLLALLVGLRAVPRSWLDLVESYGRGAGAQLLHIRAMAALPYLAAGLRIAVPAAILGAMVGEFTGAERGLGVLTIRAMRALDVDATWAIALIAAGIAIVAYRAFGALLGFVTDPPALLLAAPAPAIRRGRMRRAGELAVTILATLALWQGGMDALGLSPFFARRPGDVLAFLVTDAGAASHRAALAGAYGETLFYAVPGYLAGLALGAGLACAVVLAPGLATIVLPLAVALRSVPIVTTAPLLVLALGRGATGTITIVAVMIFFPTLVAALQGLRQAPGQVIDIFASYATGRWRTLALARVPAMLPAFFAAARMGVPAAILAATTAEWLATGRGIGGLMALTASTSGYNMLWSATALVALTATLAYALVARIERAVLRVYGPEQLAR